MQKTMAGGAKQALVGGFVALTMMLGAVQGRCEEKKASVLGPIALYSVGAFADLASTEMALRSNPGAMEGNPLLRGGSGKRAGMKVAEVAIMTFVDSQLAKSHPKGAKVFRVLVFASRIALAAHNMKAVKK